MASFSDQTITDAEWVDLYAVLGTATTNTLQIQNKGSAALLYFEAATKPATNSVSGVTILPNNPSTSILPKSGEKVWLKCVDSNSGYSESTIVAALLG